MAEDRAAMLQTSLGEERGQWDAELHTNAEEWVWVRGIVGGGAKNFRLSHFAGAVNDEGFRKLALKLVCSQTPLKLRDTEP